MLPIDEFKDKTLLITGGTGSFGNAVLKRFLDTNIREIRIFSRDEKKQDDMRRFYGNDKLKFYIGDVRERQSVKDAMYGVDYVFHAAALKQVPSCEFFPVEAVRTNVLGTENVLTCAIEAGVKKVICLSTDKAAYPINAMGMSKAIMEKTAIAKAGTVSADQTVICCTRYGNVMCSRGSVIPKFVEQVKAGQPLTVTNPHMTRFLMSLEEAVELVLFAFRHGEPGDLFIQKADSCTIGVLAEAVKAIFQSSGEIQFIGTRHGEKLFETLMTVEERSRALEYENYYKVPADDRTLNYEKYFSEGDRQFESLEAYTSHNTLILNAEEVKEKLMALLYIQKALRGEPV